MSSTITSSVTGNNVKLNISIDGSEGTKSWGVYIYAHTDHGKGQGGTDPNYNYFVENFVGLGSSTATITETPDSYVAVLALQGIG